MVKKEYEEARKRDKPCLVFDKIVDGKDTKLQNWRDNEIASDVFFTKYADVGDFKEKLDKSLSDLVEERFRSDEEKKIILSAHMQCDIMNDVIIEAQFLPDAAKNLQETILNKMKLRLIEEKKKVEQILRKGL